MEHHVYGGKVKLVCSNSACGRWTFNNVPWGTPEKGVVRLCKCGQPMNPAPNYRLRDDTSSATPTFIRNNISIEK